MTHTNEEHPKLLTILTNPTGQVVLAVLVLCADIVFNSFFYIYRPYDGLMAYQEFPLGEVYEIFPGGPADKAGIKIGDVILAIEGKPINPLHFEPRYGSWIKIGDTMLYELLRDEKKLNVLINAGNYLENIPLLSQYLGMQFLSIGLWIIGVLLVLFVPLDDVRARLLGLGFLIASLTVAVGGASGWNSFWGANTIQKVLLCLIAPILIAAHLTFPTIAMAKCRKAIVYIASAVAISLAVLVMVEDWVLRTDGLSLTGKIGISLRQVVLLLFMVSWFFAVALLVNNRLRSQDAEIRRQTGIIIWGMLLGIGPFFILTILPYVLLGIEYLPGSITILFLILLPLAYAFVIFQRKLLKIDFIINRIVVMFVLTLLIMIASILIFSLLVVIFKLPTQLPIYGGIVAALVALPTNTLSRQVQKRVDQVLYGSHYDFATVTSSLSKQLAQTLDRTKLVDLLSHQLPQQMGIRQTALLLINGKEFEIYGIGRKPIGYQIDDPVCQTLLLVRNPIRAGQIWNQNNSYEQDMWKEFQWANVFAPLIFKDELQGILLLGPRISGDVYSDQDLHIIATVAEQGALAVTNIMLVEKLRGLAQQLVRTSEDERKRLANDLHDTVLQDLFFIKQGLHKNPANPELVDFLEDTIQKLRHTIKAQRPQMLNQGLELALQGLAEDIQKLAASNAPITWICRLKQPLELTDEQAISIFRIAQEALMNAVKHAQAKHIEIRLEHSENHNIHLKVSDDGIGLPWCVDESVVDLSHIGMVLMRERALMINAKLNMNTIPGEGTVIDLEINP